MFHLLVTIATWNGEGSVAITSQHLTFRTEFQRHSALTALANTYSDNPYLKSVNRCGWGHELKYAAWEAN
jgi:hypothetical protein